MKILDKLKNIFDAKFRDLLANNTIKFFDFSKNVNNVIELKEGEKIGLDISKATDDEKRRIKEEILDFIVHNENDIFLTNKTAEKTNKIKRNLPQDKDKELLSFYRNKLNPDIHKALEGALIVRRAFNNGEDILELKRDISFKYPEFGNNLCNLVTRDYFDEYFKELYDNMFEEEGFDIIEYQNEVERIVRSLPYMVFINRHKSYEEFSGEVKFKLDRLKKYGTEKLKLHGLGKNNVEKALRIIEEYKDDSSVAIEKRINKSGTIITAIFRL